MRISHIGRIGAATLLVATLATLTQGPAQAAPEPAPLAASQSGSFTTLDDSQPPGGFPTWEDLFAEQNKIMGALEAVEAAAAQAGDTNLADSVADPTARALTLRWKGAPSAAVQQAITAQRQTVPITLTTTAAYSRKQLDDEIARIGALSDGFHLVSGDPDTGVIVAWLEGREDPQIQAQIVNGATVPVRFAQPAPSDTQPLSRQNDGAPFSGGARTQNCTLGFSIGRADGQKMLTAAHCAQTGTLVYDGGGDLVGKTEARYSTLDIAYIGGNTMAPRVWDGGPQSNLYKLVGGTAKLVEGNYTCSSGSRSGVVCNGKVTDLNLTRDSVQGLAQIDQVDGRGFAGNGDSGGPVFSLSGSKVLAQGIISKGQSGYTATCSGETGGGRVCYKRIYVADVQRALGHFSASIRVG